MSKKNYIPATTPNPLICQLLSLRMTNPPKKPEIYNRKYRDLIVDSYQRVRPRKVFKTKGDDNPVYDIKFSPAQYPDHRVLAVGDEHGYISVVRTAPGGRRNKDLEEVPRCAALSIGTANSYEDDDGPQPLVACVAWNPTGNKILGGYGNGSLRIWDIGKDEPTCTLYVEPYLKSVKRVAWGDNDSTILSCARTNEISIHDTRMRKKLVNQINCDQLNSKLTDMAVIYPYVLSSSSNSSKLFLWDVRKTYKLYRKLHPVQIFDLSSPGYTSVAFDPHSDGMVYALGSDCKIRSLDWRNEKIGRSYRVPGSVDFFSKIDVDRVSHVMVCGGSGKSAWLYNIKEGEKLGETQEIEEIELVEPFWQLHEDKEYKDKQQDKEEAKESEKEEKKKEQWIDDKENVNGFRDCTAVAFGLRRSWDDGCVQIATAGDNSIVTLWD